MLRVAPLPRRPVLVRLAAFLGLPLVVGGCNSSYVLMSPNRMNQISTVELCARRGNLLSGARMERELQRRGADCGAVDEALLAEAAPRLDFGLGPLPPPSPPLAPVPTLPPPVSLDGRDWRSGIEPPRTAAPLPPPFPPGGFAAEGGGSGDWRLGVAPPPSPEAAPAPDLPEIAEEALPPPERRGATMAPPLRSRAGLASEDARSATAEPPRTAMAGIAPAQPPHAAAPGTAATGAGVAVAPLIAPGCAERIVAGAGAGMAVAFRNGCRFPIRVRFAARPGTALSEVTPLLRPGERSEPTPLAAGFAYPGYVVCSYEHAPERALCR